MNVRVGIIIALIFVSIHLVHMPAHAEMDLIFKRMEAAQVKYANVWISEFVIIACTCYLQFFQIYACLCSSWL